MQEIWNMTFLGNPCVCGWTFDQISEDYVFCERCGRTREIRDGLLVRSKPLINVDRISKSSDLQEYGKYGYKLSPHTRLMDTLNDRRGAIAAKKAKLSAREHENSN